ncbi:MAG: maleylpyruvate isomerase N-terminal domain-containing protein [Ardenticatenaceae bacterium]|nr:maleylpyruvate isomerase N-terminal domain-containing protein [Ardenticatenaceae bacterium]
MIANISWRKSLKSSSMMGDAFTPHQLAADIHTIHDIFAAFFAQLIEADWQRLTEPNGWTLHQTVAHLDAVAGAYQQTIEAILSYRQVDFDREGVYQREDLPRWNEEQIAVRLKRPIPDLCTSFLATLQTAAVSAAHRQAAELPQTHIFPVYNSSMTLAQLYGGQAAHPGFVHAAQVAKGANRPPLWQQYPPDLLQRQITRFLHLMSLSYWPQRGQMHTTINLVVPRRASWHLRLSLEGCEAYEGKGERPSLTLWFRSLEALSRSFTLQASPLRAILTGQVLAWGNLSLAFRLNTLFDPTGIV